MAGNQGPDVILIHTMVSIIVAIAENGVIGDNNSLLWHIREDMVRFRTLTTSHPVIMGRKTYESIGKPLPNRTNVVVSRSLTAIDGCIVTDSLEKAIGMFPPEEELFIIGGAQIYRQALDMADRLYLTIVHHHYDGDTSFPMPDPAQWVETSRQEFPRGEKFEYPFTFMDCVRKR